ncbi:MAG: flavin-containing monooxygenase [Parahaliea sp.]
MSNASNNTDVIIIGAGISGLYQLYQAREQGLSVRILEAGSDVGGTWYWNRYPGCRLDSESYSYGYSFSKELLEEWSWSEEYSSQPENLKYCQYVADKFGLRDNIQFNTRVKSAVYNESSKRWEVTCESGEVLQSRYLIAAVGILSAPQLPNIKGMQDFQGQAYHTCNWPHEPVELEGKRIAVIGTGSSGVQVIQEVAKVAGSLTVFQRTPHWCAPLRNKDIDADRQHYIKDHYEDLFALCANTDTGFPYLPDPRSALEVSEEERQALYEEVYAAPGFMKWVGCFSDVLLDERANATASEFMANKIRGRVNDPETAEKLVPKTYGYGTKRVILETNYYEVYNQDNVRLVDCGETPIEEINTTGIRTSQAQHEFDVIIYATGFDPITGALSRIDIRGKDGRKLTDHWKYGPKTYLGLTVDGFPNLITLSGPHNPATLCNFTRCTETNVNLATDLIKYMEENQIESFEPKESAVAQWTSHVQETFNLALFSKVDSWFTGRNTNVTSERPALTPLVYFGGRSQYKTFCDQ